MGTNTDAVRYSVPKQLLLRKVRTVLGTIVATFPEIMFMN